MDSTAEQNSKRRKRQEKPIERASWDTPFGVYFLFLRKRLVYIGRSNNPYERIKKHRMNGRPFDDYVVAHCEPGQSQWMEAALIKALAPTGNRAGVEHEPVQLDPEPAQVIQVVEKVVYREPENRWAPKTSPDDMLSIASFEYDMSTKGLLHAFRVAIKNGDIQAYWKNPAHTGPGQRRLLRRGDVDAWLSKAVGSWVPA